MGGAGSRSTAGENTLKDLERRLQGTGEFSILERAFSHLLLENSNSVLSVSFQECFALIPVGLNDNTPLAKAVSQIGPSIMEEFFDRKIESITWSDLLQGYEKCTQSNGVNRLKQLLSFCSNANKNASEVCSSKHLERICMDDGKEFNLTRFLTQDQLLDFLLLCWLMMCDVRLPNTSLTSGSEFHVSLPSIDSLLAGAYVSCDEATDTVSDQSVAEKKKSSAEILSWVASTIPGLGDCLVMYIRTHLERVPLSAESLAGEDKSNSDSLQSRVDQSSEKRVEIAERSFLLNSGIAWAFGLNTKDSAVADILLQASCGLVETPSSEYPSLLYRSSIHGRGMNRFWTSLQGYRGHVLVLISAFTQQEGSLETFHGQRFVVGALIPGGFENKESFYGSASSCIFAVEPVFCPFHSTGRDKSYIYSHKHQPGAVYKAQRKVEGVGFGGTYGKERLWLDEEFGTLSVRHHAVDKTYHAGSLVPKQGYAPIVGTVMEVEVWGLGGKIAEQQQNDFLRRDHLFSEQRRKVDLTSFGNWGDSPEKMMMNMMSDPNGPHHEER